MDTTLRIVNTWHRLHVTFQILVMSTSHTASTIVKAEKCDSEEQISLFGIDSFNEMEDFGTDSIEEIGNGTIWRKIQETRASFKLNWNNLKKNTRKESELQVELAPSNPNWTDSTKVRIQLVKKTVLQVFSCKGRWKSEFTEQRSISKETWNLIHKATEAYS